MISFPMKRRLAPVADLLALCRLIRLFQKERPDLVHAHSAKAGFLARLAGRVCHIPVVYTPHAFPFVMEGNPLKINLYRFLEWIARPWTSALIALSQQEVDAARSIGYPEKKIFWIPNGIEVAPSPEKQHSSTDHFKIGYMGRLCSQKGVDLLPALARALLPFSSRISFLVAGDGECRKRIEKVFPDGIDVCFFGAYSVSQRDSILSTLDVLLVPSRWESCPYVVLEAWAVGVPVIASPAVDFVRSDVDGIVLPRDNVNAWANAVIRLMEHPKECEKLILAGKKRVQKDFRWDQMCERTCAVYDSLVKESQ